MSKEELTEKHMNKLARKYNVKDWYWMSSNTVLDDNGKIFSAQMVNDIEELFRMCEGKVVNVFVQRCPKMGGVITED